MLSLKGLYNYISIEYVQIHFIFSTLLLKRKTSQQMILKCGPAARIFFCKGALAIKGATKIGTAVLRGGKFLAPLRAFIPFMVSIIKKKIIFQQVFCIVIWDTSKVIGVFSQTNEFVRAIKMLVFTAI